MHGIHWIFSKSLSCYFFVCDLFLTDLLFYEVGVIGTDSLRKEVKLKVVRVFLSQEVSCVLVAQPYQAQ